MQSLAQELAWLLWGGTARQAPITEASGNKDDYSEQTFVVASLATNPALPLAPDFHLGDPCGSGVADSTPNLRVELLTGPGVGM